MKRKRRFREALSPGEERIVDAFIDDICMQLGINIRNADSMRYYHNLGWEGFLEVYRNQPASFRNGGKHSWSCAALIIHEKLLAEKRAQDFAQYCTISLSAPISEENKTLRIELLGPKSGDHQNSICFWDYLERLSIEARDAAFLARRLVDEETLEEIQHIYHWSSRRLYQAFNTLRAAMEEYLKI